jgi:hypothetical protein
MKLITHFILKPRLGTVSSTPALTHTPSCQAYGQLHQKLSSEEDRPCTYQRNIEKRSCSHCCCGKAATITYSALVLVAIVTQFSMKMCHAFFGGLFGSTVFFPYYLINGTMFEKPLLNIKCVFCFSLQILSETFLILRRTKRDMIKIVYQSASCNVRVILLVC